MLEVSCLTVLDQTQKSVQRSNPHSEVGGKGLSGSTDVAPLSGLYSILKRFRICGAHISLRWHKMPWLLVQITRALSRKAQTGLPSV